MHRISQSAISIGFFTFASFSLGFGCHLIAGIEDRGLADGGGGANSSNAGTAGTSTSDSSSSSSSSGMGGAGGGGGGPLSCNKGPPVLPACEGVSCENTEFNGCHCGKCYSDCGVGQTFGCMNGICSPTSLVKIQNKRIHRTTTNGIAVYFPAFVEGTPGSDIFTVPFDGMSPPTLLNTSVIDGYVHVVDADCDRVYAASMKQSGQGTDGLFFVPLSGGAPKPIPAPAGETVAGVESIVHSDTHVFWTYFGGVGVWQKDAPTSSKIQLELNYKALGMAIHNGELFWNENDFMINQSQVRRAMMAPNGTLQVGPTITTYSGWCGHLAVDSMNVYWIGPDQAGGSAILWTDKNTMGGTPQVLISSPDGNSIGAPIVADDDSEWIYFLTEGGGTTRTYRTTKPGAFMQVTEEVQKKLVDVRWLVGAKNRLYLVTPKQGDMPQYGLIDWVNR